METQKTNYFRQPPLTNVAKFKRSYDYTTIATDGINPYLAAFNFSINDMLWLYRTDEYVRPVQAYWSYLQAYSIHANTEQLCLCC